jgi:hypothetical protein
VTDIWVQVTIIALAIACFAVAQSLHGSGYKAPAGTSIMPMNEQSTEKKVVRWRRYPYVLLLIIAMCTLGLLWLLQLRPTVRQLAIPATNWRYGLHHIAVEPFSTPLEIGSLAGLIPPTLVSVDRSLHARVRGAFNATRRAADLRVYLLHLPARTSITALSTG